MDNAISSVEPCGAHGASVSLPFSEHEVIDDERSIWLGKKFVEADGAHRYITSVEVRWTLFKLIVLNNGTFRKIAAQLSDALALTHDLDFGKAQLLALGQILGRFVGQIGLPKRSITAQRAVLALSAGFNPGARQAGENAFIALRYPLDLIGQVLEGESRSLNLPNGDKTGGTPSSACGNTSTNPVNRLKIALRPQAGSPLHSRSCLFRAR